VPVEGLLHFWRAEAEVVEDLPDRRRVGDEADDTHSLAGLGADQRIDLVDLGDQASPTRRSALSRLLLFARLHLGG
jgi:hypothetical protein